MHKIFSASFCRFAKVISLTPLFLFRTEKLRSIKQSAAKEIDQYKQTLENDFQSKLNARKAEIDASFNSKTSEDPK